MTTTPLLALLLDVDGPLASPITRTIAIPSIPRDLAALANAGVPVIFNTGRSDAFIAAEVVPPLLAAGLDDGAPVWAICEKGAVWAPITQQGLGEIAVDASLAPPADFAAEVRELVAHSFSELVFFDTTKRAMVSVEQRVDVESARYREVQPMFDALIVDALLRRGFGVIRESAVHPAADGSVQWRIDPTIISTDIESVRLGKDLGAERALALLAAADIVPGEWRTMGDSRSDYAMATFLHDRGDTVKHVDVRPSDGIPDVGMPVLVGDDGVHDEVGAALLARWVRAVEAGELSERA